MESEEKDFDEHQSSMMISESNLGTVLICAAMLAIKVQRDVIEYKNSWWAKAFQIKLEILNHSELAFCIQLNFRFALSDQQVGRPYCLEIAQLFQRLLSFINFSYISTVNQFRNNCCSFETARILEGMAVASVAATGLATDLLREMVDDQQLD
ncbi:MAG: hypothetical protein EZS28_005783 [Streblomastix strix]|uniref:Uncharacterized protein n=1 Tax=Streblomastix strix TaxID=222440 RepID=A0A5J4WUU7_9EUKA|nr:MAG: hypothetical protein EZS28_005783 [Streblomastix strix]